MCGISGIFRFDRQPVNSSHINEMNRIIHHRGPDGDGSFVEGNIGIGSTRLAIIDLRHIADMPMTDIDERYVIVFNGEIFNYVELRNELLSKGYKFKTDSDTEVILNSYKEYGEDCLHHLNGMWAFAIWDKKEKTLFCSRDRYGIKPFYYFKDDTRFIFGSEIKQILMCNVDKSVNENLLYDFLVFNFLDHTNETFFKQIQKLPAGWKVNIKGNEFRISQWYHLKEEIDESLVGQPLYDKFYELLYDSVKLRLRSDVEVGSCLSGGLDSSSIVCIMHNILHDEGKPEIQKTYTACYDEPELDERSFVEEVINQTKSTKYYLFPNAKDLVNEFDSMAYHQDEPIAGLSVYAQWCVMKKIHETKLKVVLDGQGADEILLGYFSFFPFHLKRNLMNPIKFIREFLRGANTSNLGVNKFFQNFVYFNTPSLRYKHVLSNAGKYLNRDFLNSKNRKELFKNLIGGDLSQNRLSNLWNISLQSLLRYEDKNSMAFSIEARLPFLDHRLVELIFKIPYNELIKNGWTKNVLRESMSGKIPESVRMRKGKLAFSVPQKKWMEALSDKMKNDFLNASGKDRLFNYTTLSKSIESKRYNDKVIFRAYSAIKWISVFETT